MVVRTSSWVAAAAKRTTAERAGSERPSGTTSKRTSNKGTRNANEIVFMISTMSWKGEGLDLLLVLLLLSTRRIEDTVLRRLSRRQESKCNNTNFLTFDKFMTSDNPKNITCGSVEMKISIIAILLSHRAFQKITFGTVETIYWEPL